MPFIKTIHKPRVSHMGFLNQSPDDLRPGRDGPAIAVSDCPAAWRQIVGTNAPEVTLLRSNALWVDAFALTANCIEELAEWMVNRQYMNLCKVWYATWIDKETGNFCERLELIREAALKGLDPATPVQEDDGACLTELARKRLGRWQDMLDWYSAAIILYTREVVIPKQPLVCGIWWNSPLLPESGEAPCGQLLPEALPTFEVENDVGDLKPFAEVFPDYRPIGASPTRLLHG